MADIANWPTTSGDSTLSTGDTADTTVNDSTANASSTVVKLIHTYNGGAGQAGIGTQVLHQAEDATDGTVVTAAATRAVLTTVTAGAEVGAWRVALNNAGTVPAEGSEQFEVSPTAMRSRVSLVLPLVTKTSAYPLTATDYMCLADATSAAFSVTLPDATTCSGRVYVVKRINVPGNNVTVASAGGTIDGATTVVLSAQWQSIVVQSNGTNWFIC